VERHLSLRSTPERAEKWPEDGPHAFNTAESK
jgi:hypothetical protein